MVKPPEKIDHGAWMAEFHHHRLILLYEVDPLSNKYQQVKLSDDQYHIIRVFLAQKLQEMYGTAQEIPVFPLEIQLPDMHRSLSIEQIKKGV